jgi:hypothetical protein
MNRSGVVRPSEMRFLNAFNGRQIDLSEPEFRDLACQKRTEPPVRGSGPFLGRGCHLESRLFGCRGFCKENVSIEVKTAVVSQNRYPVFVVRNLRFGLPDVTVPYTRGFYSRGLFSCAQFRSQRTTEQG